MISHRITVAPAAPCTRYSGIGHLAGKFQPFAASLCPRCEHLRPAGAGNDDADRDQPDDDRHDQRLGRGDHCFEILQLHGAHLDLKNAEGEG